MTRNTASNAFITWPRLRSFRRNCTGRVAGGHPDDGRRRNGPSDTHEHVSADGYIAEPDGALWPDFGWPPVVQGRLNGIYRAAGLVLYGRGIYEAVVPWWSAVARGEAPADTDVGEEGEEFARLLASLPKAVVSTTMPEPDDGTRVIRDRVLGQVTELVDAEAKDVILLAGGRLTGELLMAGQLKEIVLIVGTVLIGAGRPLLEGVAAQVPLDLVEAEAFPPTTSWLRYRVC
jgi:dihydrofolate reductase